jgi:hypothetical protein
MTVRSGCRLALERILTALGAGPFCAERKVVGRERVTVEALMGCLTRVEVPRAHQMYPQLEILTVPVKRC